MKSTVEEIRERFDNDIERFSDLQAGQSTTIDSPLCLDLISQAAMEATPGARSLLDIGCGAGNYTLKLLQRFEDADATLIDLSRPMLSRAEQRVGQATAGRVTTLQADIREAELGGVRYDVVVAASVLHHLRNDGEWSAVCAKVFASLRPGGSFWIFDLVSHDEPAVQSMMMRRYGEHLTAQRDEAYRDEVFDYIEKGDTPVPVMTMMDHLRSAGFVGVEILHKHNCFAALGAVVPGGPKSGNRNAPNRGFE
ncbi:MAG: class I SAM-dependent methyltransferase [Phycisphaeraceae bacterium]|nr:class I SAM-dependent methyltransferase [Phycisphaeraceae bacterium]